MRSTKRCCSLIDIIDVMLVWHCSERTPSLQALTPKEKLKLMVLYVCFVWDGLRKTCKNNLTLEKILQEWRHMNAVVSASKHSWDWSNRTHRDCTKEISTHPEYLESYIMLNNRTDALVPFTWRCVKVRFQLSWNVRFGEGLFEWIFTWLSWISWLCPTISKPHRETK